MQLSVSNLQQDKPAIRAFTFWIGDTLYAINIDQVLTISQDLQNIQTMPGDRPGLIGMVEFQQRAVPVMNFAHTLHLESNQEYAVKLSKDMNTYETAHLEWLNALENSLLKGVPFTKPRNPHECAFGKWYDNFHPRDETLIDIMKGFDTPHKRIHALADTLLDMKADNRLDEAMEIFKFEREVTLKRLQKRFNQAREHIRGTSRTVLLYITVDGLTPILALAIDDIHDVVDFYQHQFRPLEQLSSVLSIQAKKAIIHYIKQDNASDCLLVDAPNLLTLTE